MIELGQEAKDKITGFKGILTSRHQYITGCDQYGLTPKADKKGELGDNLQFDEGRIEITGKGVKIKSVQTKSPGGPQHSTRQIK